MSISTLTYGSLKRATSSGMFSCTALSERFQVSTTELKLDPMMYGKTGKPASDSSMVIKYAYAVSYTHLTLPTKRIV